MMCKKILLFFLVLLVMLLNLNSCHQGFLSEGTKSAEATFQQVMTAIKQNDVSALALLFSPTVREEAEFAQDVQAILNFIRGDVVSVSGSASKGLFAEHTEKNDGKRLREAEIVFTLTTAEGKYHVWIKDRSVDEFDRSREGILFFHIIAAESWSYDSVYRGNSSVDEGIHITR